MSRALQPLRRYEAVVLMTVRGARAEQAAGLSYSRPLRGEILCDEKGRLYEKRGHTVRPLHQLVAGPEGQVIDVAAGPEPAPPGWDAEPAAPIAPTTPGRALFAAAGQKCIVRFGDFKPLLAPQILRPERLRDEHRLPCRVQVFEVLQPATTDTIAAALLGSATRACELHPLSVTHAVKLGVLEAMPSRRSPHGYLFRIEIESDPTRVASAVTSMDAPDRRDAGTIRAIPERFLNPWELRFSRDEVLYEMRNGRHDGRFRSWLRRIVHPFAGRAEVRKWHALMAGRTPDEQLWGVRPPRRAFDDPDIREWVGQLLNAAGYDAASMVTEWEIFWRRKGQ
jgi:hypothetical protein